MNIEPSCCHLSISSRRHQTRPLATHGHPYSTLSATDGPMQHGSDSHKALPTPPAETERAIRNGSKKRRACNECKQQKLRCDLSTMTRPTSDPCSRCKRLKHECRIDQSFRRERRRKRSDELEKEVVSLRRELSRNSASAQTLTLEEAPAVLTVEADQIMLGPGGNPEGGTQGTGSEQLSAIELARWYDEYMTPGGEGDLFCQRRCLQRNMYFYNLFANCMKRSTKRLGKHEIGTKL